MYYNVYVWDNGWVNLGFWTNNINMVCSVVHTRPESYYYVYTWNGVNIGVLGSGVMRGKQVAAQIC